MSERTALALPASIVLAGALIGTGLYFGLRRSPTGPTHPAPDVDRQAAAALQKVKPQILARCWRAEPGAHAELVFDVAFAPDGSQVALGIQVPRQASEAIAGKCVRDMLLRLQIPPPGEPAHAQVVLQLP